MREEFTGKELDKDGSLNGASGIKLQYFGKRYYDADIGFWISPDPKEQFWSHYSYVDSNYNPMIMIDPNGLEGVGGGMYVPSFDGMLNYTMNLFNRYSGRWFNEKTAEVGDATSNALINTVIHSENYMHNMGVWFATDDGADARLAFSIGWEADLKKTGGRSQVKRCQAYLIL